MSGWNEKLRAAIAAHSPEPPQPPEPSAASERVAKGLRAIAWPEKGLEVKRQRCMNEVRKEAADGTD